MTQVPNSTRRGFRWKLILMLGLAVAVVVSSGVAGSPSEATAKTTGPITLRYAVTNGPTALGNVDLMATVIAMTKGRLDIQPFYSGVLGSEAQEAASIQNGTLDLALITDATLASIEPAANITELPFFWKSQKALFNVVLNGQIGQDLLKSVGRKGMKGLGFATLGPRTVISTRPINSIADVKGMKIRVVPNSLFIDQWKAWGANPIQIAAPEVYTALQTGTVDAVDSNATGMASLKWYESAKYLANTNHQYTLEYLVMNPKKWESLGPNLQQLLVKAIRAGMALNQKQAVAGNAAAIQTMVSSGLKVTQPPSSEFLAGARQVWDSYKQQIGQPLINRALKLQSKVK